MDFFLILYPSESGVTIPVVCVVLDGGEGTLNVSHHLPISLFLCHCLISLSRLNVCPPDHI